jgi:hypothetical protein
MPEFPPLPPVAAEPLSVVLLARDDAAHVEAVVADWVTHLNGLDRDYEVLLVDDGSGDGTADRAAALADRFARVRLLRHDAPRGEGAALAAGVAAARFPLLCYARCEPRYRPADLSRLLKEIDRVHLASGYRAGRAVPPGWRLVGRLYRFFCRVVFSQAPPPLPGWLGWRRHAGRLLVRVLFGVRNHDVACPFRLIRREIFARIPLQSQGTFAHVEILAKANFLGHLIGEEVPLGDRSRPVVPEERTAEPPGHVFAEGYRVFSHPDFGPVTVATKPAAPPAGDPPPSAAPSEKRTE